MFKRTDGACGMFPHTVSDRAKPGIIAVNSLGKRFVNEALSYHEFVRAMLRDGKDAGSRSFYLICDRGFLWSYGLGRIQPFTRRWRRYVETGELVEARARQHDLSPPPWGLKPFAQPMRRRDRTRAVPCAAYPSGRSRHCDWSQDRRRREGLARGWDRDSRSLCLRQRHGLDHERKLPGPRHHARTGPDLRLPRRPAPGPESLSVPVGYSAARRVVRWSRRSSRGWSRYSRPRAKNSALSSSRPANCANRSSRATAGLPREGQRTRPGLYAGQGAESDNRASDGPTRSGLSRAPRTRSHTSRLGLDDRRA